MIWVISNGLAMIIGWFVLIVVSLLLMLAFSCWIYDLFRCYYPKYDLYLYDEVKRWNDKLRKKGKIKE